MEAQQLVCNDCGCRFEIKEGQGPPPETGKKDKEGEGRAASRRVTCPECESYNVSTA